MGGFSDDMRRDAFDSFVKQTDMNACTHTPVLYWISLLLPGLRASLSSLLILSSKQNTQPMYGHWVPRAEVTGSGGK